MPETFADILSRWKDQSGYREDDEAARALGIPRSTLNRYRRQETVPKVDRALDLLEKMGVGLSYPAGLSPSGWVEKVAEEEGAYPAPVPVSEPLSYFTGRARGAGAVVEWFAPKERREASIDPDELPADWERLGGRGPGLLFAVGEGQGLPWPSGSLLAGRAPAPGAELPDYALVVARSLDWRDGGGGGWRARRLMACSDPALRHALPPGGGWGDAKTVKVEEVGAVVGAVISPA